jgi:hypothetical protein
LGPGTGTSGVIDTLSETDRRDLVNYLRSINGQGPTAPLAASASTVDRIAVLFPVGFAAFFGTWLIAGRRRWSAWHSNHHRLWTRGRD